MGASNGFQTQANFNTGAGSTGYGIFQAPGAKPQTQGGSMHPNVSMSQSAGGNRMNQTLYSSSMRQKNLSFNRNNIANIYLNLSLIHI